MTTPKTIVNLTVSVTIAVITAIWVTGLAQVLDIQIYGALLMLVIAAVIFNHYAPEE
jgi:hypothetical protein